MEKRKQARVEELIEKAKLSVIRAYEQQDTTDRAWLEANLDSYGGESHRIKIFVLEGSPAKGIVLANYGIGEVIAINVQGNYLHRWRVMLNV